jgi:hypothetical protein
VKYCGVLSFGVVYTDDRGMNTERKKQSLNTVQYLGLNKLVTVPCLTDRFVQQYLLFSPIAMSLSLPCVHRCIWKEIIWHCPGGFSLSLFHSSFCNTKESGDVWHRSVAMLFFSTISLCRISSECPQF